jgi:hypothetical protein
MRPLMLQVEEDHYNEVLQAIKMLKYVHFSDFGGVFPQGDTQYMMGYDDKVEETPSYQMNGSNILPKPKLSTLRKKIVLPQAEKSILKQIKDSKDEWERNI